MAYLQADDIADLIKTTQRDLGRMKWSDISYTLQEHVALPMLLQREKVSLLPLLRAQQRTLKCTQLIL